MNRTLVSITSISVAFIFAACGGSSPSNNQPAAQGGGGGAQTGGSSAGNQGGSSAGNQGGSSAGNVGGGGASTQGGAGGNPAGGSSGSAQGGSGGNPTGGVANTSTGGAPGTSTGGKVSTGGANTGTSTGGKAPTGGSGGGNTGGSSTTSAGGKTGTGGTGVGTTGGVSSTGGATSAATTANPTSVCVTSAANNYWKTATLTPVTSGTADVTVGSTEAQTWDGFGGAFNELGWTALTSQALKDQAMQLLFGTDGAHFAWGRIPMGASDYATSRYTEDDVGTDVTPSGETNRPAADTSLSKFNMANGHDDTNLVPYIQAAQAQNPNLRFWASPWTAPSWMKTGFKTDDGNGGTAKKPSFFDGGTVTASSANLTAYAEYYKKFVQWYQGKNINIEIVSPQNEPGYEQNYPSSLWATADYVSWVKALGPVMAGLSPAVKLMLGTMSNNGDTVAGAVRHDTDIATAVLNDNTAKTFVSVAGVQWGVLDAVSSGSAAFGTLPIWASETKCGNYPWIKSAQAASANAPAIAAYNSTTAPNDIAYALEQWVYIKNAITKGKVVSYNAWNMILKPDGLGIDTSRDWKQDSLLTVSGTTLTQTPAYYVFRHFSQYVQVGAKVIGTTTTLSGSFDGGVAFKNPDSSIVVAMYNSGAAKTAIVSIGGKLYSFAMPSAGWATVKVTP